MIQALHSASLHITLSFPLFHVSCVTLKQVLKSLGAIGFEVHHKEVLPVSLHLL